MSERPLPYGRQDIAPTDVEAVRAVLSSDFLTTGPEVECFEGALSEVSGAALAVAVSSGTAALHAAYAALGVGPGDEVVTSPMTFASTANAALHLGATVRFVDVEPDTATLDPARLDDAVTDRTRAICAVDYAGHPADYDAIRAVADRHGLPVVADAAHSLGASVGTRPVGTLAALTAFSFHPVKVVTTGEGGALVTDRADLAAAARRFRSHGIRRADELADAEGPWWYEIDEVGLNYRITDLQCALGRAQLARLGAFVERRRSIAVRYSEAFADLDALRLPVVRAGVRSAWHLYVVRVRGDGTERKRLFLRLRELGLGVQVHYIPVHYHPAYQRLGHRRGDHPVAEAHYRECLSLPLYPALSDDDVESVVDRVRRAVAEVL
ncbi:UDP-4-amino-4,6-dideoxy-N-acetyl-beta-L-altrosamine transaminase [Rubrivirga sp. IMCC43871]|uniref:UDP-4-amino-4, 6-dideoxy-N-acetyl-beta-L-altrosamine transaminase n=1 Tax=Rubrivirga sp. IMCC43871 TaxID=3391575 RepID=UPI00398FD78C